MKPVALLYIILSLSTATGIYQGYPPNSSIGKKIFVCGITGLAWPILFHDLAYEYTKSQ